MLLLFSLICFTSLSLAPFLMNKQVVGKMFINNPECICCYQCLKPIWICKSVCLIKLILQIYFSKWGLKKKSMVEMYLNMEYLNNRS